MKLALLVGTGSFVGGSLRYLLSQFVQGKSSTAFPFGTLTVNLTGCLLIGFLFGLSERINIPQEWRLFIATGILGGFTTFSAFSNETVSLLRDGQFWTASVYVLSSVMLGLIATFTGIFITKAF